MIDITKVYTETVVATLEAVLQVAVTSSSKEQIIETIQTTLETTRKNL